MSFSSIINISSFLRSRFYLVMVLLHTHTNTILVSRVYFLSNPYLNKFMMIYFILKHQINSAIIAMLHLNEFNIYFSSIVNIRSSLKFLQMNHFHLSHIVACFTIFFPILKLIFNICYEYRPAVVNFTCK